MRLVTQGGRRDSATKGSSIFIPACFCCGGGTLSHAVAEFFAVCNIHIFRRLTTSSGSRSWGYRFPPSWNSYNTSEWNSVAAFWLRKGSGTRCTFEASATKHFMLEKSNHATFTCNNDHLSTTGLIVGCKSWLAIPFHEDGANVMNSFLLTLFVLLTSLTEWSPVDELVTFLAIMLYAQCWQCWWPRVPNRSSTRFVDGKLWPRTDKCWNCKDLLIHVSTIPASSSRLPAF